MVLLTLYHNAVLYPNVCIYSGLESRTQNIGLVGSNTAFQASETDGMISLTKLKSYLPGWVNCGDLAP